MCFGLYIGIEVVSGFACFVCVCVCVCVDYVVNLGMEPWRGSRFSESGCLDHEDTRCQLSKSSFLLQSSVNYNS